MSRLLFVSSNLTGPGLRTRRLALRLIESLRRTNPGMEVTERNLYAQPIPRLAGNSLSGVPQSRLNEAQRKSRALSDALVAEVEDADMIVIAAPMQNFSVPSTLKTWIDHIARAGRTFRFTPEGPVGLLRRKQMFVVTARSSYFADGLMSAHDCHEPYLRAVLRALGLDDVSFLYADEDSTQPEQAAFIARDCLDRFETEALAA
jgi:FMN-dependent NADH-azoreductase